jgi:hypothetical protein
MIIRNLSLAHDNKKIVIAEPVSKTRNSKKYFRQLPRTGKKFTDFPINFSRRKRKEYICKDFPSVKIPPRHKGAL